MKYDLRKRPKPLIKSKYPDVYKTGDKWFCNIEIHNKHYTKGPYKSEKEAYDVQVEYMSRFNKTSKTRKKKKISKIFNNKKDTIPAKPVKKGKQKANKKGNNGNTKAVKYKRKKFPMIDKWSILTHQEFKCKCCSLLLSEAPEMDHIIPLQYKGPDKLYNLQALCRRCHDIKTQKVDNNILMIMETEYKNIRKKLSSISTIETVMDADCINRVHNKIYMRHRMEYDNGTIVKEDSKTIIHQHHHHHHYYYFDKKEGKMKDVKDVNNIKNHLSNLDNNNDNNDNNDNEIYDTDDIDETNKTNKIDEKVKPSLYNGEIDDSEIYN